ncbi:hypothetical protein JCM16303_003109 [Sporobolomyces ruberrimus]
MTSYITLSDLESLNLTDHEPARLPLDRPHTLEKKSPSRPNTATPSTDSKRVSFCSLAVLIEVADEGEVEPAMANAFKRDLGKKQIGVRTYSLETPNFGNATSRAWNSVRNGLSATLEPLLNTGSPTSSGVVSTSRRRESSPERERCRQYEYKCPEKRPSRKRRGSVSSWSTEGDDDLDELEEEDPAFTPSGPTRLRLKIPTVTRRCSRPCGLTKSARSILRSPTSPSSSSSLPLPMSGSPHTSSNTLSATSPSSASPRKRAPPLSSSPLDKPPLPLSHPQAATLVPVTDCCRSCRSATDYGCLSEDHYVERWSRGAKKLKAEQERERVEREEWQRDSNAISEKYRQDILGKSEKSKEDEKGGEEIVDEEAQVEEDLKGSKLGQKAKGVDELQMSKGHRHVKTIHEKEDAEADLDDERPTSLRIDTLSSSKPFSPADELEPTSPRSSCTTDEGRGGETPLTSPDIPLSQPPVESPVALDDKLPFPTLPPPQPRRPTNWTKRRSSSISKRVASFGSSLFGGSTNSVAAVQGARFS